MTTDLMSTDLAAIEAIKAMKHRYWRACDNKDPEGFRRCFIRQGADMDYGAIGKADDVEPILQVFKDVALRKVDGKYNVLDMHHGLMPDITMVSLTEAAGHWTLHFRQINLEAGTDTSMTGEYDDRYVVEDGEWKMSKCHFRVLWTITRQIADTDTILQMLP